MMDEMRHLLLVVTHGTFTAAARRAGLSQPALSASIGRLEATMGARLLHRGRGGTSLTAAGEALVPRARAALAALEDGRRAVAEVAALRAGEVRLGGGATVCTFYLPPVLAAFRRDHPGLVLKLREGTTAAVQAAVAAGEVDLGLISDPTGEPWLDDEMIVVAGRGVDSARAPFVTLPPGSTTRELLERHIPDARVVMELSGLSAVVAFVRAGVGVALVSRAAVAGELRRGTLVEVRRRRPAIIRRLYLCHRGVARLPPAAAALRLRLRQDP
jgi:DNA-binding transcriptional LysR family regulator